MTEKTALERVRELMEDAGKTIYQPNDNGPDEIECRCCGRMADVVHKNGHVDHYENIDHEKGCIFEGE